MQPQTRHLIEDFLYREATLLDTYQFQAWLDLFSPDGQYLVPPMDMRDAEPEQALYLVDDDYKRLSSRVKQLLSGKTFSENPFSRTRRSVTNVQVEKSGAADIRVMANFIIHRFRHERVDTYVGRYDHVLREEGGKFLFRRRKSILDHQALRPQGKLSIIL